MVHLMRRDIVDKGIWACAIRKIINLSLTLLTLNLSVIAVQSSTIVLCLWSTVLSVSWLLEWKADAYQKGHLNILFRTIARFILSMPIVANPFPCLLCSCNVAFCLSISSICIEYKKRKLVRPLCSCCSYCFF